MNHVERAVKDLATRKGLSTISITGVLRVCWGGGITSLASSATIDRLNKLPDFDPTAQISAPPDAVNLTGLSPAERDAIILKMQASS
jgi:hypothetical protein